MVLKISSNLLIRYSKIQPRSVTKGHEGKLFLPLCTFVTLSGKKLSHRHVMFRGVVTREVVIQLPLKIS
jgi:hypothetical protein